MSTSVASVTKHFPSAENGFTTTLASTISSGATTVPLNSVAGYSNGEVAVFIVDPSDINKKQAFTGTIDTAGVQVTGVVWTSGTNQTHTAGSTVVDYASATHISMMSKGLLVEHKQTGAHSDIHADTLAVSGATTLTGALTGSTASFTSITVSGTSTSQGWTALGQTPNTITANGNRNFDLIFNGVDLTGTLSPGMRLQMARTVAAPSQSTSLNGTTQYYSKSSPNKLTFTNNFVVSAWIKLNAYNTGSDQTIISRYNGTSGWKFVINTNGQIKFSGFNGGSGNEFAVLSVNSVPTGRWVHVAAQMDMTSTTASPTVNYAMMDGVDIAITANRGGTNPTALVQAGNLEVGSLNGGLSPFNGKIAQVAVYNAKVTQATILASINRGLSGSETSLASAYSFNNSIADLNTTTPNDLTAQGSAVATNADSPFANGVSAGLLEYGIVQAVSFSTNTTVNVQVAEGCQIPTTGGVSSVYYSTHKIPYGFPSGKDKWTLYALNKVDVNQGTTASGTYYNIAGTSLTLPTGVWDTSYKVEVYVGSTAGGVAIYTTLSTSTSAESDSRFTVASETPGGTTQATTYPHACPADSITNTTATPYYLITKQTGGGTGALYNFGGRSVTKIAFVNGYL